MRLPGTGPLRRGVPLRVSLVAVILVLVMSGLALSGLVVTSSMRSDLLSRTDRELRDAVGSWARPMPHPGDFPAELPPGARRPPSKFYVRTTFPDGQQLVSNDYPSTPDLAGLPAGDATPRTVGSVGSGPQWRVIQRSGPESVAGQPTLSVVAVPLTDVKATISRLIWLELGVGAIVVVVIGLASYFWVRNSLRPLRRVEETAHAIAAGDLDQRVPELPPGTEVGSLSESLNTMLGQIQRAFAATEASEQQARASEEKMRRFVADASHELRTPLTSIKGFSDLLRMGAAPDPGDAVRRISGEADRMSLLVEDLLMLARLDAERPLQLADVELVSLTGDAVAAARAAAPGRHIAIDADAEPLFVTGDAARLTQVLRNLIGNAVVHTPAEADIRVSVRPAQGREAGEVREAGEGRDKAAGEVLVEVADTGPGLSGDDAAHVFERFYRGDSSRHRVAGSGGVAAAGNGLGLSIVAALIAAHGGRVGVRSRPGAGSTFWFTLPQSPAAPHDE